MINTLSVLIYLKTEKLNRKGKAPIYCRLTVEKKRASFSIQRDVYPEKWCADGQIVKGNNDEAKRINSFITLLKKKIYDAHYRLVDNNTPFTADTLKRIVLNRDKLNAKSLFEVFEHHNKKVEALIGTTYAEGTHERYVTALKHLKEFVAWKYKRSDFYLHEINHEFITEFDFFLRSARKCGNNTTVKYIKNFGKILRYSLDNGWIDKNPLVNFKMKVEKIDRGFLTAEELTKLHQKKFTIIRLQQVRDVFLFQCYTGLAYCGNSGEIDPFSPEQTDPLFPV